jgi:hypothetical protein
MSEAFGAARHLESPGRNGVDETHLSATSGRVPRMWRSKTGMRGVVAGEPRVQAGGSVKQGRGERR